MDILNIGAGNRPIEPVDGGVVVNHDLRLDPERPFVTVAHDLNIIPWPWEDESFDVIVARAVLEHLRINLLESVAECWRILRPGGRLNMKLPYWNHPVSHRDPTHYWKFDTVTPDIFDPDTEYGKAYTFYTPYKWRIVKPARLNNAKSSFSVTLEVRK